MAMVKKNCPVCGVEFQIAESRLKHGRGVNCSKACQYVARKAAPKIAKVSLVCIGCGDAFEIYQSTLDNNKSAGKFCTRTCRDEHWIGPLNPNYQDGTKSHDYGQRWYSTRREVLKRDGNECQHCGCGGFLHVHHKTPFRMFSNNDDANNLSNLISLCASCHRKEESRWKWANTGGSIIQMNAGGYAWELHKAMIAANDNKPVQFEETKCA